MFNRSKLKQIEISGETPRKKTGGLLFWSINIIAVAAVYFKGELIVFDRTREKIRVTPELGSRSRLCRMWQNSFQYLARYPACQVTLVSPTRL